MHYFSATDSVCDVLKRFPSFGVAESRELEGNGAGRYPTYSTLCSCTC